MQVSCPIKLTWSTEKSELSLTRVIPIADSSALLENWTYLPVWWNCQSFATRLAFLLADLHIFRDSIAQLARELHVQIVRRVISKREETMKKVNKFAGGAAIGSWVGGAITTFACPPMVGVFVVGYVGSWCICAGVSIASEVYYYVDHKRSRGFRVNMERLEAKFPLLRRLHRSISEPVHG